MGSIKKYLSVALASATMVLLMLDAKMATAAASSGITLCIQTVIPALFPFLVITTYLNGYISGIKIPGLQFLRQALHIPAGGESLLLLGLLGGYPVGAQMVTDTYRRGQISKRTGQTLLGYCNNAGPAFIFGMAGTLFSSLRTVVFLWVVHILSAVLTGLILPKPSEAAIRSDEAGAITLVQALGKSIHVCASVCGWIVLFRILLSYVCRLASAVLRPSHMVFITGTLELSNGCVALTNLHAEPARFILCTVFLAFGGICVLLQTMSVVGDLGLGLYFIGKLIQICINLILSLILQYVLFPSGVLPVGTTCLIIPLCMAAIYCFKILAEKRCGNPLKNHV